MKRVLSISLSQIEADNRVIRQCDALSEEGIETIAFGLKGKDSRQACSRFKIIHVDQNQPSNNLSRRKTSFREVLIFLHKKTTRFSTFPFIGPVYLLLKSLSKVFLALLDVQMICCCLRCKLNEIEAWEDIFWKDPIYHSFLESILQVLPGESDVIIANDWQMLPIAREICKRTGATFVYDSHEHAVTEHYEDFFFRYFKSNYIRQLESDCLKFASLVISVSKGISNAIKEQYALKIPAIVVRSTPYFSERPYRPVDENNIRLYYHGYLKRERNLDLIVESLRYLGENYQLIFRGGHQSSSNFEEELIALAEKYNLSHRFHIVPMADHEDVYRLANEHDIGLIMLPSTSLHMQFALPNKFFEYMMSGLAIGVSSLQEMAAEVRKRELGFVVYNLSAKEIASAIKKISIEQINNFKKNSLIAAREFCWEKEKTVLVNAIKLAIQD